MLKKLSILMLVMIFTLVFASIATAEEQVYHIYNTLEEYEEKVGKTIDVYNEAPALAELVAKGELEPVEERLPKNPMVIEPTDKIGTYGGIWDKVWLRPGGEGGAPEGFVDWAKDITPRPNVAKDWEVTDDNKTIIFHMREGIKWSDGEPLTADDAEFYFEQIVMNQDIIPRQSFFTGPGGEMAKFTKIDDYTFKIDFATPMAQHFLLMLSRHDGRNRPLVAPKHYLKQFHPDFVSEEELEAKVEEAGFESWADLFENKFDWLSYERPVIMAWKAVTENQDSSQFIFERNPYYWKVDTEGNQLPYIDRIRMTLVEDSEVITMRALSGDVDYQHRYLQLQDYPVLKEREEQGGYKVMITPSTVGGAMLMPNQNLQGDSVKKDIYQNKKFRYALSLAINREEINQMNHLGMAKTNQFSFNSGSPFYDEEFAKAYTNYDPERARELLDEIGLDEKDSEGYRLRPDGKKLRISLDYCLDLTGDLELVKTYFENIGLETILNIMDRPLYVERIQSANNDIGVWQGSTQIRPDLVDSGGAFLWDQNILLWQLWLQSDGEKGEEPPAGVKRLGELSLKIKTVREFDKRKEIMEEVADILSDQLLNISTVTEKPMVGVAKTNMKNIVYDGFFYSNETQYENIALPETFFFEQ